MQEIDVGEVVPLDGQFYDENGDAADPTTVVLTVVAPDGTTTTPATTHPGVGSYSYDLTLSAAGVWTYTYVGTGVVAAQETRYILAGLGSRSGPCEAWCSWADVVRAAAPKDLTAIIAGDREEIVDYASYLLYGLTNARYPGLCRGTFSVCSACRGCRPSRGYRLGSREYRCGCAPWDRADLSSCGGPAHAALELRIDGDVVPRASYRIDERRWLVRLDGDPWPSLADLTDPAAYQVTLVYGELPPVGANRAAAKLAAEIAKSVVGGDCVLPDEVTQVIREGVTYRVVDAKDLFSDGLTGVAGTDRWLAAEEASRVPGPGGSDPASDSELLRVATDSGGDQ